MDFERKELSFVSFGLALIAGLLVFLDQLLFGLFFILAWISVDILYESLLRSKNFVTRYEDFASRTLEAAGSLILVLGLTYGGFVSGEVGLFAVAGVFLVYYTEIQGIAIGLKPTGFERLFKFGFLGFLFLMGVLEVWMGFEVLGYGFLYWGVFIVGVSSFVTAAYIGMKMFLRLSGRNSKTELG
ncbi:hypothetical protein [Methanonatronarchaeum sp. AMET6-2]|uniref:hypothetical protein n=1 Tax=Methanonatronarchaeum sp. AMET6-2 TaxID=2933293 RepID=UPI00120E9DEC|nr:hypothetical protein [Methanonatronarchaeum sp. AMET6-2]RZN60308.1 MAG: hypothetical protein EF811_06825 [Methanonatronarchaeia archaeon]UOY10555.1 hypothetical protein MU439_02650 [Methanonatronarchaeum sp. AMET6-2]